MDSGDELFLIDSDGNALSRYAYDKYSPAYMRDKSGKPVFMRTDENGKELYYTLSDDGKASSRAISPPTATTWDYTSTTPPRSVSPILQQSTRKILGR